MRAGIGWGVALVLVGLLAWAWLTGDSSRRAPPRRDTDVQAPPAVREAPRADIDETGPEAAVDTESPTRLSIAGHVVDSDGVTPVDATVYAKTPDGFAMGSPHETKGAFRIDGLAPGRYPLGVRIESAHGQPPQDPVVAEAGDENVVIRLRAVVWLSVAWVDARTGRPIGVRRRVAWGADRVIEAEGGGEPVQAWAEPGTTLAMHATADGYYPLDLTVRLRAEERSRDVPLRMDPDPDGIVEVELILRDSRGDPVREITIMRVDEKGHGGGTIHRSDDGRVVMHLAAGGNRLRFGPLTRKGQSAATPWVVRVVELDLARGERHRRERVEIQRGGWLRRPRWEGRPLHRARIVDSDETFVSFGRDDYRACLAPGRYTIEAGLRDGTLLRGAVELAADEIVDVAMRPVER